MTIPRESRPSNAETAPKSVVATRDQSTDPAPIPHPTAADTTDHLSRLDALWNSSELNPAVKARQEKSARETQFMIEHAPGYARELAELKSWLSSYDAPGGGAR